MTPNYWQNLTIGGLPSAHSLGSKWSRDVLISLIKIFNLTCFGLKTYKCYAAILVIIAITTVAHTRNLGLTTCWGRVLLTVYFQKATGRICSSIMQTSCTNVSSMDF